jgi:hypothetical protein
MSNKEIFLFKEFATVAKIKIKHSPHREKKAYVYQNDNKSIDLNS